jgi:hypothetical protein
VNPRLGQFVNFFADDLLGLVNSGKTNEAKTFLLLNEKACPMFSIFTNSIFTGMLNEKTNTISQEVNCEWWRPEYVTWFLGWSLKAVSQMSQHDNPWKTYDTSGIPELDVKNMVSEYGIDYLTRDMGGRGRTFLPGLFFLTWYSQTFGIYDTEMLKRQFEKETQIPFDVYLSKLYVAHGADELTPN